MTLSFTASFEKFVKLESRISIFSFKYPEKLTISLSDNGRTIWALVGRQAMKVDYRTLVYHPVTLPLLNTTITWTLSLYLIICYSMFVYSHDSKIVLK